MRSRLRLPVAALFLAIAMLRPSSLEGQSQVRPDLPWRTLITRHFRVHFTPELEPLARRAAAQAEVVYEELARELPPPRGIIDLVVTDHVDFANGSATPFPSNRVVVHARPPIEDDGLRVHADWMYTLLVHELTHSFQLDQVRGWWRVAQALFGRAGPFFPQSYSPSWLLEGIAVHNESRLAPGGRLGGTEYDVTLRALAADSLIPRLDGISLARPYYPGAPGSYLFGSELVTAALARSPADDDGQTLRRLIAEMATTAIPWRHNRNAVRAFGASFVDIHAAWRDSVLRTAVARAPQPAPGVARVEHSDVIATPGWTARHPRYRPDGSLVWAGDDAKRVAGMFTRRSDGSIVRSARRNSIDVSSPIDGARSVSAEWEFTGLYNVRSDLWLNDAGNRERLTRNARLAAPDVHTASGRIVAVRTTPGATELVTLSVDDPALTVLVAGSSERTFADPRFSPSGTMVAAAQWERGGRASIVVLDATTGEERTRFSPRARTPARVGTWPRLTAVSHPAWIGDTLVVFTSDHDGAPFVYRGDARTGAYGPLWVSATALHTPDVSPDGARLAAVELHGEGYRVVERAMPAAPPMQTWLEDSEPLPSLTAPTPVTRPDTRYSAKSTVGPTWWLPSTTPSDLGEPSLGFFTSGRDVIGRHEWRAALSRDLSRPETSASVEYTYAGFGNPLLTLYGQRLWQHAGLYDGGGALLGYLAERSHLLSGGFVTIRPRVRMSMYLAGSVQVEQLLYQTYPSIYLEQLEANGFNPRTWRPAVIGTVGISTMQRPVLSVSVADGVAARFSAIARPGDEIDDGDAHELRLVSSAAKSLPLPGYARHVIAVRAAVAVADDESRQDLEIGGISGQSVELLPGVSSGGTLRDFFVRGVPVGAQRGQRAAAASVEYRAPITRVGRGLGFVPVGLMAVNAVFFADAGAAWCARAVTGSPACEGPIAARDVLATAGAELHLDAALKYDTPYRFRLGVARVIRGAAFIDRQPLFYFTVGDTF